MIEAADRVRSASNEVQGPAVVRGALTPVAQNSRNDLKGSLKRLVPRGGSPRRDHNLLIRLRNFNHPWSMCNICVRP